MKKNTKRNLLLSLALTGVMLGAGGAMTLGNRSVKADEPLNKGTIDVYLIGGQSNAVGYGKDTGGALAAEDSRYTYGFDNVLYYGAQERWNSDILNAEFQTVKMGCGVNSDRAGAEIGIASVLGDTDTMNAVIKCAQGATYLYPDTNDGVSLAHGTWTSPSYLEANNVDTSANPKIGRMYNWFLQTVTDGLAQLVADGYTPVIKGMWWMQGEAEMFPEGMASEYDELLRALISDVREDVSAISGSDCSEMPFVFGLPIWNYHSNPILPPYQDDVRANMLTVANDTTLKNVATVDCDAISPVQHDDWHFDAKTQRRLGEEFMACLDELTEGHKTDFEEDISAFAAPQIRVADPVGLRFGAKLGHYDASHKYRYGMLILPTDYLETYADGIAAAGRDYIKAFDNLNVDVVNLPCGVSTGDWDGDGVIENYIQGSLVGVKYANLNRAFTGIGYIYDKTANKYLYTSAYNNNTAGKVASEDLFRYESTTSAYATVANFANGAINQKNGVDEANGYAPATITVNVTETMVLTYGDIPTIVNINATQVPDMGFRFTYASADESIVTVDDEGNVTPVSVGETTVNVTCFGQTKAVAVTVNYPEIDGVTLDGVRDAKYGTFTDTVNLNDGKYYNVSAVKTENGVFVHTQALFNTTVTSASWGNSTDFEFKLNGKDMQCYVALGKLSNGVTQFVSKVEKQENNKYLHTFEFFVDKALIEGWSDDGTVQLNYAWKSPNESSSIMDDMIDYRYLGDWKNSSTWMSWHRLGGLATGFNGLVDNLQIGADGLEVAGVPANSAITVDGVASEAAYGANELNVTDASTTNVKGTVIDGDLYLAMTVDHGVCSTYNGNAWASNDNFEFYINGQHFVVMFLDGAFSIPACVTAGAATIETNDAGRYITVVELYIEGDCDIYDVRMNANGAGFAWNDICWLNGSSKYVTADGFISDTALTIDGVTLDGEFDDSAYTTAVQNSAISTTANETATVKIMGTKLEKGVLFGITITHTKAPGTPTTGTGWYQYVNPELRFANGVGYFATALNKHENTGIYAYVKSVDNGDGTYTSYFEYYLRYETIGVSASGTVNFRVGGWYETGWAWLFGANGTTDTHKVTENGIVAL